MKVSKLTTAEAKNIWEALSSDMEAWEESPQGQFFKTKDNLEGILRVKNGGLSEYSSSIVLLTLKNKPLKKSNRRLAIMLLLATLIKNNKWLDSSPTELVWLIKMISDCKPNERRAAENVLEGFIRNRLIPLGR